ncbi:hypothetical protein A2118_03325 [Candidatus Kaiserbacteria bacterium GWA2_50_9]|uniref:DUF1634 domain-containing protein n=1 Tax=Candidatus Kaiserbacteria bacterium GWA2_50_9 TaxID=1798474 RepID=A0A1F6BS73_9BACT|nr:MAG: hypothetical protein A2118_03325 [Candidatus Kaiserbacteria bacterium GWA2_50_9]
MNDQSTNIERIVMQRVHLIRALRFAISSSALSTLVSMLALWGIGREVWVAHVLQNAPANPLNQLGFYVVAFAHTRLIVQALILLALTALVYLAYEVAKAIMIMRAPESI